MTKKSKNKINIILSSLRFNGDAFILINYINILLKLNPNINIHLICNPEYQSLYSHKNITTYPVNYLIGFNRKGYKFYYFFKLLKVIFCLRKINFDFGLTLNSDLKEELLFIFFKCKRMIFTKWAKNNDLSKIIGVIWMKKIPFCEENYFMVNNANIYESYDLSFEKLCKLANLNYQSIFNQNYTKKLPAKINSIGIFPFAGDDFKCLNPYFFKDIVTYLLQNNIAVNIYIHPNDLSRLRDFICMERTNNLKIVTKPFSYYVKNKIKDQIIISPDSFGYHLSVYQKIYSILIIGAIHPNLFIFSPLTKFFSNSNHCEFFSCYNRPKCRFINDNKKFICMNISLPPVKKFLNQFLVK